MTRWKLAGIAALVLAASPALADDSPQTTSEPAAAVPVVDQTTTQTAPAKKKPRFIAALALAVPAHTYLGSTDMAASTTVTIADRQSFSQAPGIGYFIRPKVRVWLWALFTEAIGGYPDGTKRWQTGALSPEIQLLIPGRITLTYGPIFAYRFGGKSDFNWGHILFVSRPFPVGSGYFISPGLSFANFLKDRFILTSSLNVAIGRVF